MKDVGLLGGTFNPVHKGHMQLAAAVLFECAMDSIMFVPAAQPPHKNVDAVCNIAHRVKMLNLAIAGKKDFFISEIETGQDRPSYTIDTLRQLRQQDAKSTKYHFIIGCDAFQEIETWKCWEEVIRTTNFIVAVRPGYALDNVEMILTRNKFIPISVEGKMWCNQRNGNNIQFLSREIEDISSTDIRRRIKEKKDWRHLVPDSVGLYMNQNQLYS